MTGSQGPGLQDFLCHQKGTLVGVWSAALGPEVGVGVVEEVEGPSETPGKQRRKEKQNKVRMGTKT